MKIRKATEDDINTIVYIHTQAFKGFFLTSLGPGFLKLLYQSFLRREHGILRVATDRNENIVGFAAGTTKPEVFFSKLRKQKSLKFLLKIAPSIFNNPKPVLIKLSYAVFYRGDNPKKLTDIALLSSIAVHPNESGKSIGKRLLCDFEEQVQKKGNNALYLTTDKSNNDKVIIFYQNAGYQIESKFLQPGNRSMLRLIKKL